MTESTAQAQQTNIYQNPGQVIANLYKPLAQQCDPSYPYPEPQLIEALNIPIVLHPEFVPNGDVSQVDQKYGTILSAESAQVLLLTFKMAQNKPQACSEIMTLASSIAANLDTVKQRYGANYLSLLQQSPNIYPTDVGVEIMSGGSPNQDSGLTVSYGVNIRGLSNTQIASMNLPTDLKQLLSQGIGVTLSSPNYWTVHDNISSGIRYATGIAITLAYFSIV
ncbi:DUF3218 family protein [Pseudomonas citronellolis]|uniref:DUF3218 family protein n=1 Tax=Pseudomonas citronellolis TaxID=53408 RepID=UPI002FD8BF8C